MPTDTIPIRQSHSERAQQLVRKSMELQDRAADACIRAKEIADRSARLKARFDQFLIKAAQRCELGCTTIAHARSRR